jgi:DNA polymerase-3 subunit epsilon
MWIDTETTGLDHSKHDIITMSILIEIDGEIIDSLDLKIRPTNFDNISAEALAVNGFTIDDLKQFPPIEQAHKKLIKLFSKYVDRYNKFDKFQPAGYNVGFDMNFLAELFKKVGDKYFGSWIDYHKLDVASILQFVTLKGILRLDSYRLVNVAKHFGIEIDAHNAKSDILATRQVCYKLMEFIK